MLFDRIPHWLALLAGTLGAVLLGSGSLVFIFLGQLGSFIMLGGYFGIAVYIAAEKIGPIQRLGKVMLAFGLFLMLFLPLGVASLLYAPGILGESARIVFFLDPPVGAAFAITGYWFYKAGKKRGL